MKKVVDYSQFVYEQESLLELSQSIYSQLVSSISTLAREYRDNFPMSWKQRTMEEIQKLVLQKENIVEGKVQLRATIFLALMEVLDKVLEKEVTFSAPIQTEWVNVETSTPVKKVSTKDKQSGKYKEVFSLEKTATVKLNQNISNYGQTILRIIDTLNGIHVLNVDLGNAIHKDELAKKQASEQEGRGN